MWTAPNYSQANITIWFGANISIYTDFMNLLTNIWLYSVVQKSTKKYLNILEMAQIQIQIIFKGHFIRIFEYSNISKHEQINGVSEGLDSGRTPPPLWTVSKKETDCLPNGFLNKIYHQIFVRPYSILFISILLF